MNEWGIPDWRIATAYGPTVEWNQNRWRWEFYRRRPDLRDCFDRFAEKTYSRWLPFQGKPGFPVAHLKPSEAGFAAIVGYENVERFGYTNLPNPRIGDQPDHLLAPQISDSTLVVFNKQLSEIEDRHHRIDFDLDRPIKPQLQAAEDALKAMQRHRHGKTIQKRRHPPKWLTYLRVLDARADGASWSEIALILTATASTDQTARDTYQQAEALCFNF